MKAAGQHRVLVVEDDLDASRHFARSLREVGYAVDVANDLKKALELVDSKTYHAALVDIMLAGELDRTNRDGLQVLRRIRELNEGTRPIVLSGQNEPQLSADTLQEYKAVQYLDKEKIRRQGIKFITDKMDEVLKDVRTLRYGTRSGRANAEEIGVLTFLSGGSSNEAIWIDHCLRALKPAGGYGGLKQFFESFCEPLLPLFPIVSADTPMPVEAGRRFAIGRFWSKGLGFGVSLLVCNADDPVQPPEFTEPSSEVIADHRAAHLLGHCYKAISAKRSDYVPSLATERR